MSDLNNTTLQHRSSALGAVLTVLACLALLPLAGCKPKPAERVKTVAAAKKAVQHLKPTTAAARPPAKAPQAVNDTTASAAPAKPAAQPSSPLTGRYTLSHSIEMMAPVGGKPGDQKVTDWLELRQEGGALDFEFELTQANGHECAMKGTAQPQKGKAGVFLHKARTPDGEFCELLLTVTDKNIELADKTRACKSEYCGMRAQIDGQVFARSTRK